MKGRAKGQPPLRGWPAQKLCGTSRLAGEDGIYREIDDFVSKAEAKLQEPSEL